MDGFGLVSSFLVVRRLAHLSSPSLQTPDRRQRDKFRTFVEPSSFIVISRPSPALLEKVGHEEWQKVRDNLANLGRHGLQEQAKKVQQARASANPDLRDVLKRLALS